MKQQLQNFTDEEFDDEDEEDTLEGRYLIFSIEERNYGIEIQHITEIVGLQTITEVPDMPSFVKGVMNLRGKIIPLIDMRLRLNMTTINYTDRTCVIILTVQNTLIGLIVDTVKEVIRIQEDQLEEPVSFGEKTQERFISYIAKVDQSVKIILNVGKLILKEEIPLESQESKGNLI